MKKYDATWINRKEYNSSVYVYIDGPVLDHTNLFDANLAGNWFKLPVLIYGDQILYPTKALPGIALIIINEGRKILKMRGANSLVGKTILPPTFNKVGNVAKSIDTVKYDASLEDVHVQPYGFMNVAEYLEYLDTGGPFVKPMRQYIATYKFFRDVTVKACPSFS